MFFSGCDVELLPNMDFLQSMPHRITNGIIQYRTDGFFNRLAQTRDQRDRHRELVTVAVTMADIYPDDKWNFVYGEAEIEDGFGVYSFARLDPLFNEAKQTSVDTLLTNEQRALMLRRCISTMLHELGHLFGMEHCIYYLCMMNGANHEAEMDRQPSYLCPVCLHKLYSSLQFDVRQMYASFANLCEQHSLEEESVWYRQRLACIQDAHHQ